MPQPFQNTDDTPSRGIDWETALFCATWSGLALIAWTGGGLWGGLAMLFGPLPPVILVTSLLLRRGVETRVMRNAWWAVLAAAASVMILTLG